jgi:hypothetical protein
MLSVLASQLEISFVRFVLFSIEEKKKELKIRLPTCRLRGRELEILLAPRGAASLRRYPHPATPTRNPPLPLYLYTPPIRRYKTDTRLLGPFSPTRCLAGAPPPPPQLSGSRSSSHRRCRTSVECPQIRRPALRLPEAEAPSTPPNPCIFPRVRRKKREELQLGGRRGGA